MSRSSRFSIKIVIFLFVSSAVLQRVLATYQGVYRTSSQDVSTTEAYDELNNNRTENANEASTTNEPSETDEVTENSEMTKYSTERTTPKNSSDENMTTECLAVDMNTDENENTGESEEGESESGKDMILDVRGPYAAVFTPYVENGEINYNIIPEYVKYLNETGIKGILVCGTAGEGPSMNITERKKVLEAYKKEATKYNFIVIVHIGGASVPDQIELTKHAQNMSADAILAQPQMFYRPKSIEDLVDYLEVLSNAGPRLGLIYDEVPEITGVYVNIRQLFRAASERLPRFVGVLAKFSLILELADLVGGNQKLFVAYHSFATNTLMGFDTSISTVANVFLDQALAITKAVNDGDLENARIMQNRLSGIVRDIEALGEERVPIWKATMEIKTALKMGPVRSPEENLTQAQIEAIRGVLEMYGVEIKSRR